ncbi:hypothetical protein FGIG_02643 [Fasciola gigantica]|uniref:Uncharacterized protein n=1 Tax=Fasciola gigantica TaxID=46835 RepID=A0A504Y9S3_FASGI|nr:hypothetical protein FGIG_02643 [Fasciola gigantica]
MESSLPAGPSRRTPVRGPPSEVERKYPSGSFKTKIAQSSREYVASGSHQYLPRSIVIRTIDQLLVPFSLLFLRVGSVCRSILSNQKLITTESVDLASVPESAGFDMVHPVAPFTETDENMINYYGPSAAEVNFPR